MATIKSIEEKAKAYDEALKEAVIAHKDEDKHLKATLERIFPELKESEDKRVFEEIYKDLHTYYMIQRDKFVLTDIKEIWDDKWSKAKAWLEKQAEHARFREAIQVDDQVTKNEDSVLVNLSQLSRVAKKDEKQGEQKPAWSEEDNIILSRIIADYERSNEEWFNAQKSLPHGRKITWLKSLKDRVQPQQEWSEEDEDIKETIIGELELVKKSVGEINYNGYDKLIDWLKSLRPQNTWKPSDEQMEALEKVTNYSAFHDAKYCVELKRLLGQLKAL